MAMPEDGCHFLRLPHDQIFLNILEFNGNGKCGKLGAKRFPRVAMSAGAVEADVPHKGALRIKRIHARKKGRSVPAHRPRINLPSQCVPEHGGKSAHTVEIKGMSQATAPQFVQEFSGIRLKPLPRPFPGCPAPAQPHAAKKFQEPQGENAGSTIHGWRQPPGLPRRRAARRSCSAKNTAR